MAIMRVSHGQYWSQLLWQTMGLTGKGYRRHSLGNTGRGNDRRGDKLERNDTKLMRNYQRRYGVA